MAATREFRHVRSQRNLDCICFSKDSQRYCLRYLVSPRTRHRGIRIDYDWVFLDGSSARLSSWHTNNLRDTPRRDSSRVHDNRCQYDTTGPLYYIPALLERPPFPRLDGLFDCQRVLDVSLYNRVRHS